MLESGLDGERQRTTARCEVLPAMQGGPPKRPAKRDEITGLQAQERHGLSPHAHVRMQSVWHSVRNQPESVAPSRAESRGEDPRGGRRGETPRGRSPIHVLYTPVATGRPKTRPLAPHRLFRIRGDFLPYCDGAPLAFLRNGSVMSRNPRPAPISVHTAMLIGVLPSAAGEADRRLGSRGDGAPYESFTHAVFAPTGVLGLASQLTIPAVFAVSRSSSPPKSMTCSL